MDYAFSCAASFPSTASRLCAWPLLGLPHSFQATTSISDADFAPHVTEDVSLLLLDGREKHQLGDFHP